jgi:uncharacterized membrane protein
MAGIGFVLKKLSQQDNLLGWMRAHVNATVLATFPWIFTIIAFWAVTLSVSGYMPFPESMNFTIIIIYNFSFSSVFCGLLTMASTRYIADCIYRKDTSPVPGMLLGTIIVFLVTQAPLVIWFYVFAMNMDGPLALLSVANYLVIGLIWLASVYLTAIKNYNSVLIAFGMGLLIAIIGSYFMGEYFSTNGVMAGFNVGLGFCLAMLLSNILSEYQFPFKSIFGIFAYIRKFWILTLSGLVYNLAIWIDKLIMWFAPDATITDSGLRVNFTYDGAMFMAYLTFIPALGAFIFSLETSFHDKYVIFFNDSNRKVNYRQIRQNQIDLTNTIKESLNHFIAFQALFTIGLILLFPTLMNYFNLSLLTLGIFRFGAIGAFFHMLSLLLTIILSYFDCRKSILLIQSVFLALNGIFTLIIMKMDFIYYGLGYMLAAIVTFVVAAHLTIKHLKRLPYHTFITNNTAIQP